MGGDPIRIEVLVLRWIVAGVMRVLARIIPVSDRGAAPARRRGSQR